MNSSIRYPPVGTSDRLYLVPVSSLPQLKKMEVTSPASLPIWRRVLRSAKRSSRSTWQFLLDLILLDANSDCPRELAPNVLERAQAARSDHRIQVVLAKMEYEAWFLAVADSLAGLRGIGDDAQAPDDPESIRDAKGWLTRRMTPGRSYREVRDQPALTARMDLQRARSRAPSFDKMWRAVSGFAHVTTYQSRCPIRP